MAPARPSSRRVEARASIDSCNAAEALASNEVGGRYADLVAVEGDHAADVTLPESVPVVVKGGELVNGAH